MIGCDAAGWWLAVGAIHVTCDGDHAHDLGPNGDDVGAIRVYVQYVYVYIYIYSIFVSYSLVVCYIYTYLLSHITI